MAIVVLAAACASDDRASTSTPTTSVVPTTADAPSTSTTKAPILSTSTVGTTTTPVPEIDVEFSGGEVDGPGVFGVELDSTVDIWVLSDVDDEMHVHGYDLYFEVAADIPANLSFVADVPGIFEVEVHTGHTHLFDIEVSG